jgi:hypothetical protein
MTLAECTAGGAYAEVSNVARTWSRVLPSADSICQNVQPFVELPVMLRAAVESDCSSSLPATLTRPELVISASRSWPLDLPTSFVPGVIAPASISFAKLAFPIGGSLVVKRPSRALPALDFHARLVLGSMPREASAGWRDHHESVLAVMRLRVMALPL